MSILTISEYHLLLRVSYFGEDDDALNMSSHNVFSKVGEKVQHVGSTRALHQTLDDLHKLLGDSLS